MDLKQKPQKVKDVLKYTQLDLHLISTYNTTASNLLYWYSVHERLNVYKVLDPKSSHKMRNIFTVCYYFSMLRGRWMHKSQKKRYIYI